MSFALGQAVVNVQLFGYISYITITAVGYDYILTFSKEIEYIWSKPWSWVSTLFVLARYSGMCSVLLRAIWNSAMNASAKAYHTHRCNLTFIAGSLCFWVFICSADLVMIIRLWALYARSRFILGTLLMLYAIEVITFSISDISVAAQFPRNPAIDTIQVLGSTSCVSDNVPHVWSVLRGSTQLVLGAWMCLLLIIQYIKESVQMYKVTKQFRLGHYQRLLTWEGLVYFIATLGCGLNLLLVNAGLIPADGRLVLTDAIKETLPFMLFPRLVLSLRRLYMRDLEGRRGSHMDTAFGLGSQFAPDAFSAVMFADAVHDEEGVLDGEIPKEEAVQEDRCA